MKSLLILLLLVGTAHAERIGPLAIGMTEAKVKRVMGNPKEKGKPHFAGEATADFEQDWQYEGVTVTLAGDTETAKKWTVRSVVVTSSTFKTDRGIRIGSTRAQLKKAHPKAEGDDEVVAGDFVFTLVDGKVTKIFLGAAF